jgi:hypothetical protein
VRALLDELADMGFDPSVEDEGPDGRDGVTGIAFHRCPFRELAGLYPDLVCELHRGLTEGILDGLAETADGRRARLASFSSLVDIDPCRVEVTVDSL